MTLRIWMALVALGFGFTTHAEEGRLNPKTASKQIEAAIRGIAPAASSKIDVYTVTPTRNVRAALLALALKEQYIDSEEEFQWVGNSNEAWEADSTNWGETHMKDAYEYITRIDEDQVENLKSEGKEAELKKYYENIENAKSAFKGFLKTGVKFGVAPMGAVQCGVTFAGLAIIDPYTGKIYIFSKEPSGC